MAEDPTRERTFIMVKPDGVQRNLVGEIIKRFEQRGFRLLGIKMMRPSKQHLETHYQDLSKLPFFPKLIDYMLKGPVVPMVFEGYQAAKIGRAILGETNPINSAPGTIRGDFCQMVGRNVVHGSDSPESAIKEINLWFKPEEIHEYTSPLHDMIHE